MAFGKYARRVYDTAVTLLVWTYYTFGFVVLFAPFYLAAYLLAKDPEASFQRLNSRFYGIMFRIIRILAPGHRWRIAPEVSRIRSSVIVCNHLSYLDPILLISLYPLHKTIVKSRLFSIPVFGRMLTLAGYVPSSARGKFADAMIRQIESMEGFLAAGGNLFIFPEGTRSRTGRMGALNPGAFKIARRCHAAIKVLVIRNTDRMFKPGRFVFSTAGPNTITVDLAGSVETHEKGRSLPVSELMESVSALLKGYP
ncbi:MAG: 1-acyl-sn-glycerol-3-phosphate acyltransferase [Desulfobacterales bacterium]|nr:1-acyl-sn-glycerol-3-phosphate acyltransferase [Desulfobacterales bacterium]